MKDLDMIKAFAELEGVPVELRTDVYYTVATHGYIYNPLSPNTLNLMARDKYKVENDFDDEACFIYDHDNSTHFEVDFNGNISRATIECILKSKGLWSN